MSWREELIKQFLFSTPLKLDGSGFIGCNLSELESFIENLLEKQKVEILNIVDKECRVLIDRDKIFKNIDTEIIQFRDGLFSHFGLNPKEGE